jgi:serine/threonine protein kinase
MFGIPKNTNWTNIEKSKKYEEFIKSNEFLNNSNNNLNNINFNENLFLTTFSEFKNDKELLDLILKCLKLNPSERITANEALKHKWFKSNPLSSDKINLPPQPRNEQWYRDYSLNQNSNSNLNQKFKNQNQNQQQGNFQPRKWKKMKNKKRKYND